mmetsp:Transcript_54149/g.126477  ORF Transcript_54149/g.126477 Transcript_54149/m.126477 type:complete len:263 (-) Transcript_54149:930-1718(-)
MSRGAVQSARNVPRRDLTAHPRGADAESSRAAEGSDPEREERHDCSAEDDSQDHLPAEAHLLAAVDIGPAEVLSDEVNEGDVEEDTAAHSVQRSLQPHLNRRVAAEALQVGECDTSPHSEREGADEEGHDESCLAPSEVHPDSGDAGAEAEALEELVEGQGRNETYHGAPVVRHHTQVHADDEGVDDDAELQHAHHHDRLLRCRCFLAHGGRRSGGGRDVAFAAMAVRVIMSVAMVSFCCIGHAPALRESALLVRDAAHRVA